MFTLLVAMHNICITVFNALKCCRESSHCMAYSIKTKLLYSLFKAFHKIHDVSNVKISQITMAMMAPHCIISGCVSLKIKYTMQ